MTARRSVSTVLILSVTVVAAWACRERAQGVGADAAPVIAYPAAPSTDAQSDAGPKARCRIATDRAPAEVVFGEGAELGEVVPFAGGLAIGMLRSHESARLASVVRLDAGAASPLDIGPSWGDTPPPQPVVGGGELYSIAYVRPDARSSPRRAGGARQTGRALSIHHVGATVERLLQLPAETDASSAYDVIAAPPPGSPVGAIVAWDDMAQGPPCGRIGVDCWLDQRSSIIQLAVLSPDLRAIQAVHTVRAADGGRADAVDAGDPRLAARNGGYFLTWIARRPEHPVAPLPLPAGEVETSSEEATYGWVEAIALDAQGSSQGTARRLTSATGHVGSYTVTSQDGLLVVVAEDEGPSSGRGGGTLERVAWGGEASPDSSIVVRAGVEEETPPTVISGTPRDLWLSFLDLQGNTEVVPLDMPGTVRSTAPAVRGLPSREPIFDQGRLLAALGDRIAFATTDGTRWTLRWAACTR